jgi:hypothetical protein
MNHMRIKLFAAAFMLLSCIAFAAEPLVVNISNAGVEISGVTYKTKAELVAAFRKLNPSAVRFVSAQDVSYQAVSEAFRAFQESGIKAQTGFVGVMQEEK